MDGNWIHVANVGDFANGEVRGIDLDGRLVALYRLDDGSFFATDDICTHEYARLSEGWLEGDVIECPLHAGQFNVRDGAALCAPVTRKLDCFVVRVSDEKLWLNLTAG